LRLKNILMKTGALHFQARRLIRDQRGVALVETIFAAAVLAFFILIAAQLYYISDLACYTMAAVHRQTLTEVHDLDNRMRFRLRNVAEVTESLPILPGMQTWLEYFSLPDMPQSFSVTRQAMAAGGSYTGIGQSIYTWADPFCKHKGGMRVTMVAAAFAREFRPGQWSPPDLDKLLNELLDDLLKPW
jgi:hypothetical protein